MRNTIIKMQKTRRLRALRNRKKLRGTETKPRLCVVKSNKHIQVQIIDDSTGRTLGMAATFSKEFRNTEFTKKNKESARKLGERIAEIAKSHHIKEVVFDRGGFVFHGRIKAIADGAREGGLKF